MQCLMCSSLHSTEEDDQELTYADVNIVQRPGRQMHQKAEMEVEYGQVKFSGRPQKTVQPKEDECVYAKVRNSRWYAVFSIFTKTAEGRWRRFLLRCLKVSYLYFMRFSMRRIQAIKVHRYYYYSSFLMYSWVMTGISMKTCQRSSNIQVHHLNHTVMNFYRLVLYNVKYFL